MTPANLVMPDSKATRNKIARDRRVKAKSASLKNKTVAGKRVAAISKGDDKSGFIGLFNGGGRLPPFYYCLEYHAIRGAPIILVSLENSRAKGSMLVSGR